MSTIKHAPRPAPAKRKTVGPSRATRGILALLFVMVSAYVIFQIADNFNAPYHTVTAYPYNAADETSLSGFVVRDESVLPSENGGVLSLERREGERVGVGQRVANVYADSSSMERDQHLKELYRRLDHLNFALSESTSTTTGVKLDSSIQSNLFSFRENIQRGQFSALEQDISELEALIIRRDYSSAANTAEEITAEIKTVQDEIKTLRGQQSQNKRAVTVQKPGLFSASVDGYEAALTPEKLQTMTPTQLAGVRPDALLTSNVGKMIYGDTWYYAANMDEKSASAYKVGKRVTLRFATELSHSLPVEVERISDTDNGQKLVVFRCEEYLPEVTLLRRQSASIIHESYTGIRVPTEALRVNEGVTGVYCLVGMQASFKPVDVVYQGDGYYLVTPSRKKDDTENTSSTRLRAGDSVLITAEELYPGKVIEL